MRIARLLLCVLSALIFTACLNRYTCAEALLKCPGCSPVAAESFPVPFHITDESLPQNCVFALKNLDVYKVTGMGDPGEVLRLLAVGYRNSVDDVLLRNARIDKCKEDLEKRRETNFEIRRKYCSDLDAVFVEDRNVCVRRNPSTKVL